MSTSIHTKSVFAAMISSLILASSPVFAETTVGASAAQASHSDVAVGTAGSGIATSAATYTAASAEAKVNESAVIHSVNAHGAAVGSAAVNTGNNVQGSVAANTQHVNNAADAVDVNHRVNLLEQSTVLVETGDGVQIDLSSATSAAGQIQLKTSDIQDIAEATVTGGLNIGSDARGELNVAGNTAVGAVTGIASDLRQAVSVESRYDISKDLQIQEEMSGQIATTVDAVVVDTRATADAALDASLNAVTEVREASTSEIHNSIESGLSSQLAGGLSL